MYGVGGFGIGVIGNAGVLREGESRALFGMDGSGQGVVYIATMVLGVQ